MMSEDIKVEVEKLQALGEEESFKKSKVEQDKEETEKSGLKEKLDDKKTEKQTASVQEGVNVVNHLAKTVQMVWNMIAVPRGVEPITDQDRSALDEAYKDLKPINVSPEGNALIGTLIVVAPKIVNAMNRKTGGTVVSGVKDLSKDNTAPQNAPATHSQGNELQGLMTGGNVRFADHPAMK